MFARLGRGDRRVLAATAVLAIGVPAGAAAWVRAARGGLEDRLSEVAGVPARIGGIDADLTGAIRITGVSLGELASADALEASIAMGSLLAGHLRADELRVDGPRIALRIDPDGDSDLARLARRLAHRGAAGARAAGAPIVHATGLRRILVARGALTARIAGLGELSAEGVELVPDAGGVRVITGPVRFRGAVQQTAVDVAFARGAAEVALPELRFRRVLAVGGTGTAGAGDTAVVLRDLAAGRLDPRGPFEIRTLVVDGGAARPLAIDLGRDRSLAIRGDRIPLRALAALAPPAVDLSSARATGELAVRRGAGALELSADVAIDGLVVDHPAFAAGPAPLSGHVRGDLSLTPDAVAWTRGGLSLGAARFSTTGWVRRAAPLAGRIELALAPAPCADLLASLPAALRGPLDGMVLEGALGARARLAIDLGAPLGEGAALESAFEGACLVASEPPAADVTALAAPGEQQLLDGTRRRVGRGEPDHAPLDELPAHIAGAFVAVEDARFFEHAGFDLPQIARSLEIDLRERRLARGGSTISQQLVKNAFLSQRRSLDRKLHEAVLAWRLEARLTKRQILERYLNVIELGPRIFGITAAARHWFGVPARELTVHQAAFLAALTAQPAPMSRRVRRAGGLDPDSAERVATVLRAMRRDGTLTTAAHDAASSAPLRFATAALRE